MLPAVRRLLLVSVLGCANSASPPTQHDAATLPVDSASDAPPLAAAPLEVKSLGVQGFVVTRGADTVLTAPMFTRQSVLAVTLNIPLAADTQAIDAGLGGVPLSQVRAVVSGHAHFDHFIDVPHILAIAPNATAYSNATGKHMLAALAPDRPASCTSPVASPALERQRVVAMDDPNASHVDYTNCPRCAHRAPRSRACGPRCRAAACASRRSARRIPIRSGRSISVPDRSTPTCAICRAPHPAGSKV